MWSICQKDIQQFFSNLTGYIAMILFLLVNGIFLFILSDSSILDYGYASLDKFFDLAPWILMFLVPAISMRSLAEEFRTGTFELLKTSPLSSWQIVLGKYLSICLVIAIVILPTITYVFTVQALSATGGIDMGALIGSYLGLFLLAALFAAISLCCSSFTSNTVAAFLISTFMCLVLYYGFTALSRMPALQGNADYYIEMAGIDFHYRSISRGVVDSRDLVYFLSASVFFLLITVKNVNRK